MFARPLTILAACLVASGALAQSTAFTYQGELKSEGQPAAGLHDLRFKLFDAVSGGAQIGTTQCADNVVVTDGRFTTSIDFGPQFTSTASRFLEIEVRRDTGLNCANTTGYTLLSPRQPVTPAPRATAATTANSLSLPNGSSVLVNLTNTGLVGIGTNAPTSQLHLNGVQDAFKISGNQPFMTLMDTNANNIRVLLQNESGRYFVVSEDALNGTNPGAFTMVDQHGRLSLGNYAPTGPFEVWVTGGQPGLLVTYGGNIGLGTTTPTAKLDVRGNVKLGANGEFFAPSSQENLRIIRGSVDAAGNIVNGSGFTISRTAPGVYLITFSTPFANTPTITASARYLAGYAAGVAMPNNVTSATAEVVIQFPSVGDDVGNRAFFFMAIGPR